MLLHGKGRDFEILTDYQVLDGLQHQKTDERQSSILAVAEIRLLEDSDSLQFHLTSSAPEWIYVVVHLDERFRV